MLATAPRYYTEQQNLTALAVRQLRRTSSVDKALPLLAIYQANAALLALEHGNDALREQGIPGGGEQVIPEAFTVTPGVPSVLDDADTQFRFDRIVSSLVADAGRSAMGVFTASRREERVGSIRQLTSPSCQRCAVLAGRWYRWSEGFKRHPRCDCVMVPGSRSVATYDPHAAFKRGEITDLSTAQTKAIQDGADISQVVNAQRGMQTVNFAGRRVQVTTEGRRGAHAGVRTPRLSPEAIYNVSDGSRDTAIRLLRANGYIV